jgi:hypothetical protein
MFRCLNASSSGSSSDYAKFTSQLKWSQLVHEIKLKVLKLLLMFEHLYVTINLILIGCITISLILLTKPHVLIDYILTGL